MIPIKTESAWKGTSNCRTCGIRDMVLFADLTEDDFQMIHAPVDDLEFGVRARSNWFVIQPTVASASSGCCAPVIQTLQAQSPRLHQKLMEKWSGALKEADDWQVDINFWTARARVRNFVLKMRGALEQLDKHGRVYRILSLAQLQSI